MTTNLITIQKTELSKTTSTNLVIQNIQESLNDVGETVLKAKSDNTLKNYNVAYKQFDEFLLLNQLTPDLNSIALFLDALKKDNKSYNTISLKLNALKAKYAESINFNNSTFKAFMNGLKNQMLEKCQEDKTKLIEPKKALSSNIVDQFVECVQTIYHEQIISLSNETKSKKTNNLMKCKKLIMLRNICLLRLGYALACRQSELLSIQIKDIAFDSDNVSFAIYQQKTKQHVTKVIPSDSMAIISLKNYLEFSELQNDYLFQGINQHGKATGKKLDYKTFYNFMKLIASKTKTENVATHSLRRGLATDAIKNDVAIFDLMKHLGQLAISSTQRYVDATGIESLKVTKQLRI